MTEPTGNRWNDPDTIWDEKGKLRPPQERKIANPRNLMLDTYQGKDAAKLKYGPAVLNNPDDEVEEIDKAAVSAAAGQVGAQAALEGVKTEELTEVRPSLGTAFQQKEPLQEPPAPDLPAADGPPFDDDYEVVRADIKKLGGKAKQGDPAATSELNKIAETEYDREDGGRLPIKRLLASYGVGRPQG